MHSVLYITDPSDSLSAHVSQVAEGRLQIEHTSAASADSLARFAAVLIGDQPLSEPIVTLGDGRSGFLQLTRGHHRSVDVAQLNANGVIVAGSAPVLAPYVAPHALGLAVSAMSEHGVRGLSTRDQVTAVLEDNRGSLAGKTLGIVGFGRMGQAMASLCASFGMQVIYADVRTAQHGSTNASKARRSTLDLLLSKSDIVSLHALWGPTANPLISARELRLMKEGAILINTADARLVDTSALEDSLKSGKVRAGFDVEEPAASEIAVFPHSVVTPYVAARTEDADREVAEFVVSNIEAALSGGSPSGIIEAIDYPRAGDPAFWSSRMWPRAT